MNKNIYKIIPHILAGAAVFGTGACVAFAQADTSVTYAPLTTLPGVFKAGQATNPVSVVKGLYGLAIGVGSVIAVVMIILAGFKYMYEESISGKSGAKDQIQNAFLGLLVILGSYILLRTINADLVTFNPQLPGGTGKIASLVATDLANAAAIKKALADYQTQMTGTVAPLQSTVNDLTTQLANINKAISDTKASTTLSAAQKTTLINTLQQSKTDTETCLTTANTNLTTARNAAENSKLDNLNQINTSELEQALAKGDIVSASSTIDKLNNLYQAEITRRGGTDSSIQTLQTKLSIAETQAVVDGQQANIINNMINRTDGYAPDYVTINQKRAELITTTQAAIDKLKLVDPATAATLTTKLNDAVASIDAATATKQGCKLYDSTPTGIKCRD